MKVRFNDLSTGQVRPRATSGLPIPAQAAPDKFGLDMINLNRTTTDWRDQHAAANTRIAHAAG
jgi:hypothetical protein